MYEFHNQKPKTQWDHEIGIRHKVFIYEVGVQGDVMVFIVKSSFISELVNKSISLGKFPEKPKEAQVVPCYKKSNALDKSNYRPVSILPGLVIYNFIVFYQYYIFLTVVAFVG
jgi:hypothetical protein